MRVVVGCPVAERGWVLQDWIDSVRMQQLDGEVDIVCLYTRSHDDTLEILQRNDVRVLESPLPTRPFDRMRGHNWSYSDHEYEYMASIRNELRETIANEAPDWFFSLDSDIILPGPGALSELISAAVERQANGIAPLVNMMQFPQAPPAWNWMTLRESMTGADRKPAPQEEVFQVSVIMAAMLLDRQAMMIPWANHPQGEDIGWSIKASLAGLRLFSDTRIVCEHRMVQR